MSNSAGLLDALTLPPANAILVLVLALGLLLASLRRAALKRELWRPLAVGLAAILLTRIAVAVVSLLSALDGSDAARTMLGHADRSASLICGVLLVWLLARSYTRLAAWVVVGMVALAVGLAAAAGSLLYATVLQVPGLHYNTTLLAPAWDGLIALASGAGAVIILLRKPAGRALALAMLAALAVGAILQIVFQSPAENFAVFLRAAEVLVAVLMVGWLAADLIRPRPATASAAVSQSATVETAAPEAVAQVREEPGAPEAVAAEPGPPEHALAMAEDLAFWAARTLNADVALVLARLEDGSGLQVTAGYDLVRSQPLLSARLPGGHSARVLAQMSQEGAHAYPASDLPADYKRIANAVGLEQPGPALLMPLGAGANASTALLVLSPYSGREWSNEDKLTLGAFAAPLAPDLVTAPTGAEAAPEPQRARGLMTDAELANLRAENSDLAFRLRQAQEELQSERQRADTLETQLTKRPASEGIQEVEAEVARLEEALAQVLLNRDEVIASLRASLEGHPAGEIPGEELQEYMAEHSEEVQRLRSALDRAEKELERQGVGWDQPARAATPRGGTLGEQVVLSLARELLKAVLSVRSDSELLAIQGAALLGSMQRQPLEHLRDKAYQAEALAQDLESLAAFARSEAPVDWGPLEVGDQVDAALTASSELIRERGLSVHLELPERRFEAEADRACVRQLLYHLIRNAVLATPPQSEVGIRAHLRVPEGGPPSALLVSVDDGGAGIAPDDYPMVFDALARGTGAPLAGLGEKGIGMAVAHELALSVGGRIWVESQPGQGSTFSIEVPLAAPPSGVFA